MKKVLVFFIILGIIFTSVGVVGAADALIGPEGGKVTRSGETNYEEDPNWYQVTERLQERLQQGEPPR